MADTLQQVIARFPEHEATIRALSGSHTGFDTLCREYGEVTRGLEQLGPGGVEGLEADELRRRRTALEEELIALVQQTARV